VTFDQLVDLVKFELLYYSAISKSSPFIVKCPPVGIHEGGGMRPSHIARSKLASQIRRTIPGSGLGLALRLVITSTAHVCRSHPLVLIVAAPVPVVTVA